MKIGKLSLRQGSLFGEYRDKWLAIGLCTDPLDFESAKAAAVDAYCAAGIAAPRLFFRFRSPIEAAIGAILVAQVGAQVGARVGAQVRDQVLDQVRAQVLAQVGDQVGDQVWDQVRAQVLAQVGDQVWAQVRHQVWDQVRDQVRAQVRHQVWAQVRDQVYGSHDAACLAYFDFFGAVCGLDVSRLSGLMRLAQSCGWWAPYRECVFFQDRPCAIHWQNKMLHNDHGPAVEYRDGFGVYSLHGVRMAKKHVLTPAEQLAPREILDEPNAEVRRELVRKVGVERFVYKAGARTLDQMGEYQLLEISWPDGRKHRYLKMHNPSVPEVWHVEGVGIECETVRQALHYRKPDEMRAIPVAADGNEWYQQGDVCLWPDGATALQEFPRILT